jgi:hypothetical protein
MNRKTNAFELTDGDGYAAWFSGRNDITGGHELVRVVRLCKYLRDEHDWQVKSIPLTTLLRLQVHNCDKDDHVRGHADGSLACPAQDRRGSAAEANPASHRRYVSVPVCFMSTNRSCGLVSCSWSSLWSFSPVTT